MAQARIYWLHCLSPTHVGTGRGVGYIDLPIQRDAVTNWPLIPGSAFKGVWADHYRASEGERKSRPELRAAFGLASDREPDGSNAGALIPTDARIVCLPVRSFQGTFAWCTSALVLEMLRRDLELAGGNDPLPSLTRPDAETVLLADDPTLIEGNRVYLEDLDFAAEKTSEVGTWADWIARRVFPDEGSPWREEFRRRFAVLPNEVFDFLTETGTEVTARVRIDDDTKTVADGALWNEEALPAETILAGLIACDRLYVEGVALDDLLERFATEPLILQIGGKATVGRGRVRCIFTPVNGRTS